MDIVYFRGRHSVSQIAKKVYVECVQKSCFSASDILEKHRTTVIWLNKILYVPSVS